MRDSKIFDCYMGDENNNHHKPESVTIVGHQPLLRHGVKLILDALELEVRVLQQSNMENSSRFYGLYSTSDVLVLFKHVGDDGFYRNLTGWLNLIEGLKPRIVVLSDTLGKSDWANINRGVVDLFLPMKAEISEIKSLLSIICFEPDLDRQKLLYWTSFWRKKFMPDILDLSPCELQVVTYLQRGICNREIADQLHVAESTVRNHMQSISQKLDMSGRTNIAILASRQCACL